MTYEEGQRSVSAIYDFRPLDKDILPWTLSVVVPQVHAMQASPSRPLCSKHKQLCATDTDRACYPHAVQHFDVVVFRALNTVPNIESALRYPTRLESAP